MNEKEIASSLATLFVHERRDDLAGINAEQLAESLTDQLLAIGDAIGPAWNQIPPDDRFFAMYDAACIILVEHMNPLYSRIKSTERFYFRTSLCRLLISYVWTLSDSDHEPAFDYLIGYHSLVCKAMMDSALGANRRLDGDAFRHAPGFLSVNYFLN